VGVITAPNVDSPVAGVSSGTLAWTTRGGSARVNFTTGEGSFDVEGLVLNGGNATGTPGPINRLVGTIVCNPGADRAGRAPAQASINPPAAALSWTGNAGLSLNLIFPAFCNTPLFLVRIPQFGLRWIAAGAVPTIKSDLGY